MREIQLSKGKVALVDDEDYNRVSSKNWQYSLRGVAVTNYNYGYKRNKLITMHRFILEFPEKQIDHINGNKLDNRKENLRLVTNQENAMNLHKKKGSNYVSKYVGVTFDSRKNNLRKRWVANIKYNYKKIFLGRFETEKEAALAYNKKAKELGFLTRNIIGDN